MNSLKQPKSDDFMNAETIKKAPINRFVESFKKMVHKISNKKEQQLLEEKIDVKSIQDMIQQQPQELNVKNLYNKMHQTHIDLNQFIQNEQQTIKKKFQ